MKVCDIIDFFQDFYEDFDKAMGLRYAEEAEY